jgi:formylglycine-generating enzyme required for sulfatase activity
MDEALDIQRLTGATDLVGSLGCVAPEQAAGKPIDARADVWALGALLYEGLCGLPPHDLRGRPVHEILRLKTAEPLRLGKRARHLRGDIEHVVSRALAVDPRERYATAGDLGADLRRLLANEEVHARKDGTLRAARRLVTRHRGAASGLGLVVIALTLGTIATSIARDHAEQVESDLRRQTEEVRRLSDRQQLDALVEEARTLWPARQERMPAMLDWTRRARLLTERLPLHRETLARWEAESIDGTAALSAGLLGDGRLQPERAATERAWRLEKLRDLVDTLERFSDDEASFSDGFADIRRRIALAEDLERRLGSDDAAAWEAALASIADPRTCPQYGGLQLPVHAGLVPLGRDPRSGLWEFAHIESGHVPIRCASGDLVFDEQSAIVLVLIPGGRTLLGVQGDDPDGPLYDPDAQPSDPPARIVELEPFFLARSEVTQAQWIRMTGSNPSYFWAGWETNGQRTTSLNPVESISWGEADRVLERVGLLLPTSDQWEHAARAGVTTRFVAGQEPAGLEGYANFFDHRAMTATGFVGAGDVPGLIDDGFVVTSPVGSFHPNAFGLYDVLGNVAEFVQETRRPPLDGDQSGGQLRGAHRGGSFYDVPDGLRLGSVSFMPIDRAARTRGVRPMLPALPPARPSRKTIALPPPGK